MVWSNHADEKIIGILRIMFKTVLSGFYRHLQEDIELVLNKYEFSVRK